MVASYLEFRGWIRQDTRCNGMSVTFDLSQPLALDNGFIEAMRRPQLPYRRRPTAGPSRGGEPAKLIDAKSVNMVDAGPK